MLNAAKQIAGSRGHAPARMLLLAGLAFLLSGSCDRSRPANKPPPANPDYMRVVSLSECTEDGPAESLVGPDGKRWCIDPDAGLNLAQCDYREVCVVERPDERWGILLPVNGPVNSALFHDWFRRRVGSHVGVVLGGRLAIVTIASGRVEHHVVIPAFSTEEEATRAAAVIRAGGVP